MTAKKPTLTVKEQKLIQGIVTGKTKKQAAKDAGYAGDGATLSVNTSKVLSRPTVQDALRIALEKHGLTPDSVVGVVADGMKATRTVIVRDKEATGEAAEASAFADEVPDHSTRLKAAGMAANFMGVGKDTSPTVNVNFVAVANQDKDQFNL